MCPARGLIIDGVLRSSLTFRVLRNERLLNKSVQPIYVDIREDWANCPTLWRSAQGGAVVPFFEVSGLEDVLYQPEEAVIGDALAEDAQQDRMIDIVETSFDVTLDEPFGPVPHPLDTLQRGVAPAPRPETVREVGELRLVVRFQDGADHVLQE